MSSEVVYTDGLVIGEGGEILELPEGCLDKMALLAHHHADARENEAAWKKAKSDLSRALVPLFPESVSKVVLGDLSVRYQTTTTQHFSGADFLRRLARMPDITRNEILLLVSYAKGFDVEAMEKDGGVDPEIVQLIKDATARTVSDPYVITANVAKPAPTRRS